MTKQYYGWRRQAPDPRDRFRFAPNTVSLPSSFKLPGFEEPEGSGKEVPRLDQGAEGSCGPNTAVECILSNQRQEGLTVDPASRQFIYYNTRALMGTVNQDSGVDNRSMLKALAKWGWCPESLWPYVISKMTVAPPDACYTAALPNTKLTYAAVVQSLAQMKGVIYGTDGTDGDPFVFGFEVYQQIESEEAAMTGMVRTPSVNESPIGGHDVTFYGWDDIRGVFFFRNHWRRGPTEWWGNHGNGTIGYDYALSPRAGDFWIINTVPGAPVPPPPPSPPPPSPDVFVIPASGTYTTGKTADGSPKIIYHKTLSNGVNPMMYPYPSEFPGAEIATLLSYLRGNLPPVSDTIHAAWSLIGYGLAQTVGATPAHAPTASPLTDKLEYLLQARQTATFVELTFDWQGLIRQIIADILSKLLGG